MQSKFENTLHCRLLLPLVNFPTPPVFIISNHSTKPMIFKCISVK